MATNQRRVAGRRPSARRERGVPRRHVIDPEVARVEAPPLDPVPPERGWREEVMSLSGLNLIAGIWLIIAPWVLSYAAGDPQWNDFIFGIIVAGLALIRISGAYREWGLSAINAAIGVWLFIAAFTIDQSSAATTNDIILGVIVFVLGVASAAATPKRAV